ncbi:MAG: hypothetical protein RL226_1461 [Bacteroidota bacterium]
MVFIKVVVYVFVSAIDVLIFITAFHFEFLNKVIAPFHAGQKCIERPFIAAVVWVLQSGLNYFSNTQISPCEVWRDASAGSATLLWL